MGKREEFDLHSYPLLYENNFNLINFTYKTKKIKFNSTDLHFQESN